MPDRQKFDAFRHQLQRVFEECPSDQNFRALLAAFAFQLSSALSAMPDDFWVTPIVDADEATDAELEEENTWHKRLESLFRAYL